MSGEASAIHPSHSSSASDSVNALVHRDMMQRCVARCFPAAREENTIDRLRERYGDLPPTVRDLDTGETFTVDELERERLTRRRPLT